ncbi:MAG: aldo/keto reductase [Chloroflexi bacterium]|nr:aldo/keto reductase [Chloroflexota bacterium]MBU1751782.1 aldo/keto reductase [Chloroflexota bacterium]
MKTNKLGRTGLDVSVIGLGMEHLVPLPDNIAPVVHRALDRGITYIDLMIWVPEVMSILGETLKGRRDQVILAAHLSTAQTKGQYRRTRNPQECEALFHDILDWLGTDHVDVLHLSNLDAPRDYKEVTSPGGVLDLALRLKQEGQTRALGLSGHDPQMALKVIESEHLDVVMHPINIAGDAEPGGKELAQACASLGVGLVAMKPFAGGQVFQRENPISPVQCLSYTLAQPGVSLALMGVKNLAELEANLRFLDATDEEKDFSAALQELRQGLAGTCVYCNHCLPCSATIDIAVVMRMLAAAERYGVGEDGLADYADLSAQASDCIECGDCKERCPFEVDIIANMRRAAQLFEGI